MFGDNFMGGVTISPNMKRTKDRIDTAGNIINPETKEIIQKNDPGYIPTKEEVEAKINVPVEPIPVPQEVKALNPLAEAIKKQVQNQIKKTIEEVDIASMVKKAVEEAFR